MKKAGFFVICAIFVVILLENLLRLFYNPPQLNPKYQTDGIEWMQRYVHLNSQGYRDKEYGFEKKDDTYRIFAIGDSYTFGWFIDDNEKTYPRLIEKGLKSKLKKNIEVINGAQWGFNFTEITNRYSWEAKRYSPDLVVLGLTHFKGDISNSHYIPRLDLRLPQFIRNSYLYHLVLGQFFQAYADNLNEKYLLSFYEDPNSPVGKEFFARLKSLNDEIKANGSNLAIVLFPHIYPPDANAPYSYMAFNNSLSKFGKENGAYIIDPLSEFIKYPNKEELALTPTDAHPTEQLHQLIANKFIEEFDELPASEPLTKQEAELTKEGETLGKYHYIDSITSSFNLHPWTYLEQIYGESQIHALDNPENAQTYIFSDRLITSNNTYPGPELTYFLYPKENGMLVIPTKVHGYEVAGLVKFYGINKKGTQVISPTSIIKQNDVIVVNYSKKVTYDLIRAHISLAANQISISPKNEIVQISTPKHIQITLNDDIESTEMPLTDKILGYSQLDSSQGLKNIANIFPIIKEVMKKVGLLNNEVKLTPAAKKFFIPNSGRIYMFVDGVYLPAAQFTQENNILTLNFDKKLKSGTKLDFYLKVEKQNLENTPLQLTFY